MNILHAVDPEAAGLLSQELVRQAGTIELVASENFVYPAILEAQGSVLTNKYAEGYPGARYHGGCEFIDSIETLAIERAKRLFGADQPRALSVVVSSRSPRRSSAGALSSRFDA